MKLSIKRLFLIDGIGAGITACSLGILMVRFQSFFGMPERTLYALCLLPILYAIYSLYCFRFPPEDWRKALRAIAIANLGYCAVTMGLVVYHFDVLTVWGIAYFVLELLIIVLLALYELQRAKGTGTLL